MKKTYQQPMLIIVSVKQHLMQGASPVGTNIYDTNASSQRGVLSRRNTWDDDDEFDE